MKSVSNLLKCASQLSHLTQRSVSQSFLGRLASFTPSTTFSRNVSTSPALVLTPAQKKEEALKNFPKHRIVPKKTIRNKHNPSPHIRAAHPWLFIGHTPTKKYSPRKPWSLSSEEYRAIKTNRTKVKIPLDQRLPSPDFLMRTLRLEEIEKTKVNYPREVAKFRAGDRLKITKYISLGRENKFEVVKGLCLAKTNKANASTFRIINHRDGLTWEMVIPLWSPFIKKIEVLQKSKYNKAKVFFLRKRSWEEFMTK